MIRAKTKACLSTSKVVYIVGCLRDCLQIIKVGSVKFNSRFFTLIQMSRKKRSCQACSSKLTLARSYWNFEVYIEVAHEPYCKSRVQWVSFNVDLSPQMWPRDWQGIWEMFLEKARRSRPKA